MSLPFRSFSRTENTYPDPPSPYEFREDRNFHFIPRVSSYLMVEAYRLIQKNREISVDDLAEAMWAAFPGQTVSDYDEFTGGASSQPGVLTSAQVDGLIQWAAAKAHETYSDELVSEIRRRAAKGGRVSRRPPSFTQEMLQSVAHLSRAAAAKELGCSQSTIARFRRAVKRNE